MLGFSYLAAFAIAGLWVHVALTVLWTTATSGIAFLGTTYRTELIRLRIDGQRAAVTDGLTGLANRSGLAGTLDDHLQGGNRVVLGLLDLDRFKLINDSLGHRFGDEVLVTVGTRLTQALEPTGQVARIGGDEFAIVIPFTTDPSEVFPLAEKALDAIEAPFKFRGKALRVKASAGLTVVDSADEVSEFWPRPIWRCTGASVPKATASPSSMPRCEPT